MARIYMVRHGKAESGFGEGMDPGLDALGRSQAAAVAEIPSPKGMSLEERSQWLRRLMVGSWRAVPPDLAEWREACIATVAGIAADSVIFSHYVAINVIAGAASGDDRVVNFSPDNCSVTIFETNGAKLSLLEKGSEAPLTKVN